MKKLCGFCMIICLVMSACKADNVSLEGLSNSYLPLATGNYWKLENMDKRTVTETRVFDQKTYYAITTPYDTSYVRNENDKIVEYDKGKISVRFDLTAGVNTTWQYRDYKVTLTSKTESIKIGRQNIKNCYRFYFDMPAMADEEYAIWLAPGIGFIQYECLGFCGGGKMKLKEMGIDTKIYTF